MPLNSGLDESHIVCEKYEKGARMGRRGLVIVLVGILVLAGAAGASAAPFAYITNQGDMTVSVIDTATNTVTATVIVESSPTGVAVSPDGSRVYVANLGSNMVSVIDATKTPPAVIANVTVIGSSPFGVAVSQDGSRVYVTNRDSNNVSVIDATKTPPVVIAAVAVGGSPLGVAVSPDGSRVYVANGGGGAAGVSVIDTTKTPPVVSATLRVGISPFGVAVSPDGSRAYVTNSFSSTVSVIDTTTTPPVVTATVPVGNFPTGIPFGVAVSPDGSRVYVANSGSSSVSVIDVTKAPPVAIATVTVGAEPLGVAVTPDGSHVYVANSGSTTVSVIDATKTPPVVSATVPVGRTPFAFGKFISPLIPFAAFSVKLDNVQLSTGSYQLTSTFTLGAGSDGIAPLTEPVTIRVGTSSITIPAGSFQQNSQGFVFLGLIGVAAVQVHISPQGSNTFTFKAQVTGASLSGTVNPVTVGLMIGDDTGTTTVTAILEP